MTDEERERLTQEIQAECDAIAEKYVFGDDTDDSTIERMKEEIKAATEGLSPHTTATISSWREINGHIYFNIIVVPHIHYERR